MSDINRNFRYWLNFHHGSKKSVRMSRMSDYRVPGYRIFSVYLDKNLKFSNKTLTKIFKECLSFIYKHSNNKLETQ